jgi:hypothetical protein
VNPTLSIDVFSARGFLGGSEYEQYKMSEGLLWRECGAVRSKPGAASQGSQPGDQIFSPDPSLNPAERRVEDVQKSEQVTLEDSVNALLAEVNAAPGRKNPLPGGIFSLAEPGLFEMAVEVNGKKTRIVSSVDAVSEEENDTLVKAKELFSKLRAIGPVICNARTFFGIHRQES